MRLHLTPRQQVTRIADLFLANDGCASHPSYDASANWKSERESPFHSLGDL